ncbi:MAG: hypothetical protein ACREMC_00605 [Gemmatimonadales bacterium]
MTPRARIAALFCAALLSACDAFEKNAVQEISGPVPTGAQIKFFNFGVNAPAVNFYADSRKMTAVGSTSQEESSLGVAYGGVGAGGFYTAIGAESYTLMGKISAAGADKDRTISSLPATLEEGRLYSFYQSGFYDGTAKTVDAFIVEDNFTPQFDYTVAYVRFVNAIANASPMILYATKAAPPDSGVVDTLGAAVAYKGASAFMALTPGLYNLAMRYVDSTANKISRTGVSFLGGRIYTIGARGDITVTSTTATNRPFLDNTTNR